MPPQGDSLRLETPALTARAKPARFLPKAARALPVRFARNLPGAVDPPAPAHLRAAPTIHMTTLYVSDLLAALGWRYATKTFDPARPITDPEWDALLEALRLAPSSFGLQPWKFIDVRTPDLRTRLREASWGQTQVTDASRLVVLAVKQAVDAAHIDRVLHDIAVARGVPLDALAGYRKMIDGFVANVTNAGKLETWSARQVYIAAGQLMTSAAVLGIDTCPLEGIDPARYDELLGLGGTGYTTLMAIAVGHRSADDKYAAIPKVRFPASDVIEHR